MKTQSIGQARLAYPVLPQYVTHHYCGAFYKALENYRKNRENGLDKDNPKKPFPSEYFKRLDTMQRWDWPGGNEWPDKEGRHWWRVTLGKKNGRTPIINDFYWMKDDIRGWPDMADKDRFWFTVHCKSSGTQIEGFSQEMYHSTAYPDGSGRHLYYIQFNDTQCPEIQQWMKEKDINYLRRIQKEDPELYNKEVADLEHQNDPNDILASLWGATVKYAGKQPRNIHSSNQTPTLAHHTLFGIHSSSSSSSSTPTNESRKNNDDCSDSNHDTEIRTAPSFYCNII